MDYWLCSQGVSRNKSALDNTNQLTVFDAKGVNITATILQITKRPPATPQAPEADPAPPEGAATNFPEIM